jgi:protein TonB
LKQVVTQKEEEKPYQVVEQMPTFPGGTEELMKFISNNMKYPTISQENGIQGRVICRFVVSKDGTVQDIQIIRSLDPYCDKEAMRVLKLLPRFIPGKQNGRNVPVYFTLPVVFRLQ